MSEQLSLFSLSNYFAFGEYTFFPQAPKIIGLDEKSLHSAHIFLKLEHNASPFPTFQIGDSDQDGSHRRAVPSLQLLRAHRAHQPAFWRRPLWHGLWAWLMLNESRTWLLTQRFKFWRVSWARYQADGSDTCKLFTQNLYQSVSIGVPRSAYEKWSCMFWKA